MVGLEPGATQPVGLEMKFEFLDPVPGIAAAGVDGVINPRGRLKDVGHQKAGVESSVEPLDLGNNPTRSLPGAGFVAKAAKESCFSTVLANSFSAPINRWAARLRRRSSVIRPIVYLTFSHSRSFTPPGRHLRFGNPRPGGAGVPD